MTALANQLLQAGLIPQPVYDTAIDSLSGQPTRNRVTNLLSSAKGAVKHRNEQHFVRLCEIVREVGDSAVADKLLREANITRGRSIIALALVIAVFVLHTHHCS